MVNDHQTSYFTGNCVRSIFFFNPLTKAKILMPSRLQCEGKVTKIVASAKPSDPDCVVECLFVDVNMLALSGISDQSWTLIKGSHQKERIIFKEIEILDGKLYALNHFKLDSIFVCDLQNKPIKPKLLAAKNPSAAFDGWVGSYIVDQFRFLAVESSSGELLLIHMFDKLIPYGGHYYSLWWESNESAFVPNFIGSTVFKFNFIGSDEEAEWIEVKNLGNRMLFVGRCKSLVVSNIGLHGPQDLIKDNCIYFTCKVHNVREVEQWKFIKFGRFCEADKKTEYHTCERLIPNRVLSSI